MATLSPLSPSSGAKVPGKSMASRQAAQITLTTSWQFSDWVPVGNFTALEIWLGWVQATETSITVVVQTSDDDGTTFGTRVISIDAGAGDGTGDATPHQLVFTRADWSLTDFTDAAIAPVHCHGAKLVRVGAIKTGTGSPTIQPRFTGAVGG